MGGNNLMAEAAGTKKDYKTARKELIDEIKFLGNDTVSYVELSDKLARPYQLDDKGRVTLI